jgi:hypothetical protein
MTSVIIWAQYGLPWLVMLVDVGVAIGVEMVVTELWWW